MEPEYLTNPPDPGFRVLRQLQCPAGLADAGRRHRLAPQWMDWFPGETMIDRLARALADRSAIDMKEFCEGLEFFERVRRQVRRTVVADLCCGHGFTGLLFALLERSVETVLLLDRRKPKAFDAVFAAVCAVGPWVEAKVRYVEGDLRIAPEVLPAAAGVVGVHACGRATDRCLDAALATGGPVAVMPCCHGRGVDAGPPAMLETFGRALAADVHRTYRLEAAGYRVRWTAIPRAITPKNRIILAQPG